MSVLSGGIHWHAKCFQFSCDCRGYNGVEQYVRSSRILVQAVKANNCVRMACLHTQIHGSSHPMEHHKETSRAIINPSVFALANPNI